MYLSSAFLSLSSFFPDLAPTGSIIRLIKRYIALGSFWHSFSRFSKKPLFAAEQYVLIHVVRAHCLLHFFLTQYPTTIRRNPFYHRVEKLQICLYLHIITLNSALLASSRYFYCCLSNIVVLENFQRYVKVSNLL